MKSAIWYSITESLFYWNEIFYSTSSTIEISVQYWKKKLTQIIILVDIAVIIVLELKNEKKSFW